VENFFPVFVYTEIIDWLADSVRLSGLVTTANCKLSGLNTGTGLLLENNPDPG
jgi:hypothetical protein